MFKNDVDVGLLISFGKVECPGKNLDEGGMEVQLLNKDSSCFLLFHAQTCYVGQTTSYRKVIRGFFLRRQIGPDMLFTFHLVS